MRVPFDKLFHFIVLWTELESSPGLAPGRDGREAPPSETRPILAQPRGCHKTGMGCCRAQILIGMTTYRYSVSPAAPGVIIPWVCSSLRWRENFSPPTAPRKSRRYRALKPTSISAPR